MKLKSENMNMLDELILEQKSDNSEEVVIGLVGAVGSNLAVFQNILKTELENTFDFSVFVIKVSKDILSQHPNIGNVKDFDVTSSYKRIDSLMNLGNKLRELYGDDYIALEVASQIRNLRKSHSGSKCSGQLI